MEFGSLGDRIGAKRRWSASIDFDRMLRFHLIFPFARLPEEGLDPSAREKRELSLFFRHKLKSAMERIRSGYEPRNGAERTHGAKEAEEATDHERQSTTETSQPIRLRRLGLTRREIGAENEQEQERQVPQDVDAAAIRIPELNADQQDGG